MLEIGPAETQGFRTTGLFLSVDEDRNIILEKLEQGADLKKFLKSPAQRLTQKTWEGNHLFKSRRRVIAAVDSSLATTIPVPLTLMRDHVHVKTKITIAELENLIAEELAKIWNSCRDEAARRLGREDLETILVETSTGHFKVDEKPLRSPVGFAGKKISLLLTLTFTSRELFENLKPFFNLPEGFFFVEAPQARLRALSRVRDLPLNLIVADGAGASLYIFMKPGGEHAVLYREKLNWTFSLLTQKIREALTVSEAAAKELYCLYHKGEMSEAARRAFKKTVEPALQALFRELERAKVKGPVYIDMPDALPFALPLKHGAITFEEHPIGEVFHKLGFSADLGAFGENKSAVLRPLLYFLEAYFDREKSLINRKLRRRLHWLAG